MRLSTKILLANLSVRVMLSSAVFFVFSAVLLVFFLLFRSQIDSNLGDIVIAALALSGAITVVACALYVGLSLNIPPEIRYKDTGTDVGKSSKVVKIIFLTLALLALIIPTAIIVSSRILKDKDKRRVESKVDVLAGMYQTSIIEMPRISTDTVLLAKAANALDVMSKQSDMYSIELIFVAEVNGVPAFVKLSQWDDYATITEYGYSNSIYLCSSDCEYLAEVLNGKDLKSYTYKDYGYWYVYRAFDNNGQRFILKFTAY